LRSSTKRARRTLLRVHPRTLAGPVRVALALRDDALESACADGGEQRLAVLERRDQPDLRPVQVKFFEQRPPL
jgi:hypothetical protein